MSSTSYRFLKFVFFAGLGSAAAYAVKKFIENSETDTGKKKSDISTPKRSDRVNLVPSRTSKKASVVNVPKSPIVGSREDRIMQLFNEKSAISVADIAQLFPDINVRTIRRDMDKLESKGLVEQKGTTRSTVYVRK